MDAASSVAGCQAQRWARCPVACLNDAYSGGMLKGVMTCMVDGAVTIGPSSARLPA